MFTKRNFARSAVGLSAFLAIVVETSPVALASDSLRDAPHPAVNDTGSSNAMRLPTAPPRSANNDSPWD
ncbi:hypothetical protein [Saccharothrix sp. NRRL B-16314]|uniref:hypothetical protein n=1 Tax=Saccharothrix sp. NRRL B-16314 TaxID=1463825 RepID=UPI0012DE37E3|nr:hypothetical protein [Saccharothrix sp. NRRL B-16314]